ncbi:MAG: hypothetical protein ABSF12_04185 [Bryobacteraceae bacterium]
MDTDLVAALRSRAVTVVTPLDAGLIGKPDEDASHPTSARANNPFGDAE